MKDSGKQGKINVATFDLSPGFLKAVAAGEAAFAIDQQQFLVGAGLLHPAGRGRHGQDRMGEARHAGTLSAATASSSLRVWAMRSLTSPGVSATPSLT